MTFQPNYERIYGSKYAETKDLDIIEVAKLIKKELRSEMSEVKWSVRTSRYSGGQSINVKIKDCPADFKIYNPEWLREVNETGRSPYRVEKYTKAAQELLKVTERIVEAYNFDGSETMVDYFDVRFYKHIDFDRKFEKQRQEKELEDLESAEKSSEMTKEEKMHTMVELGALKERLEEAHAHVAQLKSQIEDLETSLAN